MKIGRPLKFEHPDDLIKVCEEYFNNTPVDEYTVTGLALAVGGKQLLQDYEKREEYKDIIKRAKLIVENRYELRLIKHGRSGDIFALKNFGWTDNLNIKTQGSINVMISPEGAKNFMNEEEIDAFCDDR